MQQMGGAPPESSPPGPPMREPSTDSQKTLIMGQTGELSPLPPSPLPSSPAPKSAPSPSAERGRGAARGRGKGRGKGRWRGRGDRKHGATEKGKGNGFLFGFRMGST